MEECVLNELGDLRMSQPTGAPPAIELTIDALNGISFSLKRLTTARGRLSASRNVTNCMVSGESKCGR
jgi:hypothetical protein